MAGFYRGLIDEERGQDWKTAGADDWAVGRGISYGWSINDKMSIGPGLVVAYDFDNDEFRSEIELNISVAF